MAARKRVLRYTYIACLVCILLYIHLFNSTEHSPFWQVCSSSPNKAIRPLLYNSKVHYHVHKSPPLVTVVSQINPLHPSPRTSVFEIKFDITSLFTSRSSQCFFPARFRTKILFAFLFFLIRVKCGAHLILLIMCGEEYN